VAAFGLAVAELAGFVREGAPAPASPLVGAVNAGAVRLISQHPVRPGGRPPPAWPGTRIRPSTTWNCGLSPRWPTVITTDGGLWCWSQARHASVLSPPRERPSP
jgi:hypothetical protein